MAPHSTILAEKSLVGFSPWGNKETDTQKKLSLRLPSFIKHTVQCSGSNSGRGGKPENNIEINLLFFLIRSAENSVGLDRQQNSM